MTVDNLLINVFAILAEISGWQALKHIIPPKYHQWVLALTSSLVVFLCMDFPFRFYTGQFYDLRLVVLFLVVVYGGYFPGIFTVLVAFTYRYMLGGFGFIAMVITFTPFLIATFYLAPRYHLYSKRNKIALSASIISVTVILNILLSDLRHPMNIWYFKAFFEWGLVEVSMLSFVVLLIEIISEHRTMTEKLHEAEKSQLVSSLTASMAHEVRNPLTVSRGFVQLLGESNTSDDRITYTNMALSELDRACSIIEQYLSISKPEIGKLKCVDSAETVQYVLEAISPYATLHNVTIKQELEPVLKINIDSPKFIQAVLNIMKNGIEAMPSGGTLTVNVYSRNKSVVLDITDTGIGMTPEQVKKIGNPFYSTKTKGTGLGLMMTFRIIHLMKGSVHVTSKVNFGTTFSIVIPLSQDPASSIVDEPPDSIALNQWTIS